MTSGVHDMCGAASVVPQTVPNQICCVFVLFFFFSKFFFITAKENCVEKSSHCFKLGLVKASSDCFSTNLLLINESCRQISQQFQIFFKLKSIFAHAEKQSKM